MKIHPVAAHRKTLLTAIAFTATVVTALHVPAFADGPIRTVVLSGDQLPGVPAEVSLASSTVFRMNNRGHVLFKGHLSGPGIIQGHDDGLWLHTPAAGLEFIVRDGEQAPGSLDGIDFFNLDLPELNDAGEVQVRGLLGDSTGAMRIDTCDNCGTDNFGDWVWRPSAGLSRLAVGEDPTPTLNQFFTRSGPPINNFGQQVRGAQIAPNAGGPADSLWLLEAGSQPQLVVQRGAPAPALPSGIVFRDLLQANVNNAGQILYQSKLGGTGVSSTNDEAVWLDNGMGVVNLIAREGDPAPGLPLGVVYDFATGTARVGDGGRVALSRLLRGPGINSSNNFAWWTGDNSSILALVAREGDPAPGTGAGVVFDDLLMTGPAINALGRLATAGVLRGDGVNTANDIGIWFQGPDGALALLAREGDPAPGAGQDVVFDFTFDPSQFPIPIFSGSLSLNDSGQVMVQSGLAGEGVTTTNDRAIWANDSEGALQLIVREGQELDVDNGSAVDLRTINTLASSTPPKINNLGQVIFGATFTDGSSGIFVSSLVAVPEPPSLLLLASCASIIFGPRRLK